MKSVLVTGGAGFFGSHLCEALLEQGCHVVVIDNFADAPCSNLHAIAAEIELIEADIRDEQIVARVPPVDTIFHLAANANVPRSAHEPLYDASVNILGTINALQLARNYQARFFLASSGAVYGEPVHPPMAEAHPTIPISPYGASKLAAEHYVELNRQLYGIRATIIRLFNMYGPRQRRFVVFDFARKILAEGAELQILGDGRQIRSQLYVQDAVRALLLIAEAGELPVYNIGSARSFSVSYLLNEMLDLFGHAKTISVAHTSWDGDIQRLVPDVSRLQALGFQERYTLQQGLQQFKEWFMSEYALSNYR